MAGRIAAGEKLPFFLYDTPYSAQNRLRDLLAAKSPLVLLFMANFGHPITRTFANRYAETFGALRAGSTSMNRMTSIPGEFIQVLQALVILFVSTPGIVRMFLKKRRQKKEA